MKKRKTKRRKRTKKKKERMTHYRLSQKARGGKLNHLDIAEFSCTSYSGLRALEILDLRTCHSTAAASHRKEF